MHTYACTHVHAVIIHATQYETLFFRILDPTQVSILSNTTQKNESVLCSIPTQVNESVLCSTPTQKNESVLCSIPTQKNESVLRSTPTQKNESVLHSLYPLKRMSQFSALQLCVKCMGSTNTGWHIDVHYVKHFSAHTQSMKLR